jgi:hypothetical protein
MLLNIVFPFAATTFTDYTVDITCLALTASLEVIKEASLPVSTKAVATRFPN